MNASKQSERGYQLRMFIIAAMLLASIAWLVTNFQQFSKRQTLEKDVFAHTAAMRVELANIAREANRLRTGDSTALVELAESQTKIEEHIEHLGGPAAASFGSRMTPEMLMAEPKEAESAMAGKMEGMAKEGEHGGAGHTESSAGHQGDGHQGQAHTPGAVHESVSLPTREARDALTQMAERWRIARASLDSIFASHAVIRGMASLSDQFDEPAEPMKKEIDAVLDRLTAVGAPVAQVRAAAEVKVLLENMHAELNEALSGSEHSDGAAREFGEARGALSKLIAGLKDGDNANGIPRIGDAQARSALQRVSDHYEEVNAVADKALRIFPVYFDASESASVVRVVGLELAVRGSRLQELVTEASRFELTDPQWVLLPGAAVVIVLLLAGLLVIAHGRKQQGESDRQRQESEDVNKRTQAAILTLLDEMSTLADGDLTVKTTVTEEITGAIADSVNYAIDELRKLVAAINTTSSEVARAARRTRATAVNLAEASDHQAQQITSATRSINEMASSIEQVSKNAQESAEVAKRSLDIAHKGSDTVQRTIMGMDNIREQIQETSKRIKRLGESSQEIGAIVGLINDIADQTNILALNAAIQAAMAGEAGRGFAVVADEVQRLAERSTDATKQIEALIKTIQTDTNEAVHSMEQSTAGVVAGAKLAEDAGIALTEIETVSGRLFELVTSISDSSQQQTRAATEVSNTMNVIQDITKQVSAGTSETAESIGNLAELANELHDSVAGFKLPEEDMAGYQTLAGESIPELGAEAVVEPDQEELVSLGGSAKDEMDLMAELSQLHSTLNESKQERRKTDTLVLKEGEDELSADLLEELAAELDAAGDSGLDVDLGRSADAGRK